jgi:hypothetical protein
VSQQGLADRRHAAVHSDEANARRDSQANERLRHRQVVLDREHVDRDGEPRSLVWKQPGHLGDLELAKGMGGIASPLLAGFSLAAIATVVSADKPPPLTGLALASLAAAAGLLLLSMQCAFHAAKYGIPPDVRLTAWPEAMLDERVLQRLREEQAQDHVLARRYRERARFFYNVGLLAFSVAVALLIVPTSWSVARIIAFAIAILLCIVELWWVGMRRGPERASGLRLPFEPEERWKVGRWRLPLGPLLPAAAETTTVDLDETSKAAVMTERDFNWPVRSASKPVPRD